MAAAPPLREKNGNRIEVEKTPKEMENGSNNSKVMKKVATRGNAFRDSDDEEHLDDAELRLLTMPKKPPASTRHKTHQSWEQHRVSVDSGLAWEGNGQEVEALSLQDLFRAEPITRSPTQSQQQPPPNLRRAQQPAAPTPQEHSPFGQRQDQPQLAGPTREDLPYRVISEDAYERAYNAMDARTWSSFPTAGAIATAARSASAKTASEVIYGPMSAHSKQIDSRLDEFLDKSHEWAKDTSQAWNAVVTEQQSSQMERSSRSRPTHRVAAAKSNGVSANGPPTRAPDARTDDWGADGAQGWGDPAPVPNNDRAKHSDNGSDYSVWPGVSTFYAPTRTPNSKQANALMTSPSRTARVEQSAISHGRQSSSSHVNKFPVSRAGPTRASSVGASSGHFMYVVRGKDGIHKLVRE